MHSTLSMFVQWSQSKQNPTTHPHRSILHVRPVSHDGATDWTQALLHPLPDGRLCHCGRGVYGGRNGGWNALPLHPSPQKKDWLGKGHMTIKIILLILTLYILFWDSIQVMAASLCGGIYSKLSTVITPGDNGVSLYGFYLQTASSCTVLTWTAQHMVQITAAVTVQLNKKSTPCTPQGWAKIYARISSHPKYLSKRHYRTICTTVKKKVEKRCQTWMYNSKGERGRETW